MSIQTVVITGASSGIGQALALRLASKELALVVTGRDISQLDTLTAHCQALGAQTESIVGDINKLETVQKISERCSDLPPLTGLVNNAGFGIFGPSETYAHEDFASILQTNVLAPFFLAQALFPKMKRGPKDSEVSTIVNVGSDAGVIGFEEAAAYCASKGGLHLMSSALRAEWRTQGVRVTTVAPGRVDTCFNGKKTGMRPGALSAESVAEVIEYCLFCNPILELSEVHLDSMARG